MTVDTMEITSRQKIFEIIRKHQLVTVSELNYYLEMTPANIRHHLAVLIADGLVERVDLRKKVARGRPESVYAVNTVFIEDGLETLVMGILRSWLSTVPAGEVEQIVQSIARQLAKDGVVAGFVPVNKKLTMGISYLNSLHYIAQWEASPSGPRVKLGNCPYRKIINHHPELCLMDKYLLDELVGLNFSQVTRLEHDEIGKLSCRFIGH